MVGRCISHWFFYFWGHVNFQGCTVREFPCFYYWNFPRGKTFILMALVMWPLWWFFLHLSGTETLPEEKYCWWKKSCISSCGKYTITCRVSYISGGAGCLPSTVWTQLKVSLYIPMIGHGLDGYCESMAGVNCYFCILAGIYFELANSPLGFMFRRFLTFYFGVRTIPVALWYSRY